MGKRAQRVGVRHHNLRLAIVGALHAAGLRRLDWGALRRAHRPAPEDYDDWDSPERWEDEDLDVLAPRPLEDDDYALNTTLRRHLLDEAPSDDDVARIERLEWPDAEIQYNLYPQWDGEDETFELTDLTGIEACAGLRTLRLQGPLVDLQPLLGLARLESLELRVTGEAQPGVRAKNQPVIDALRARGVKVVVAWPRDRDDRAKARTAVPRSKATKKQGAEAPAAKKTPQSAAERATARREKRAREEAEALLPSLEVTWLEPGLVRSARLSSDGGHDKRALATLLAAPYARTLTELDIEYDTFESPKAIARLLADASSPPPLRRLTLRTDLRMGALPFVQALGDLAPLWPRYPLLEHLHLEGEPRLGAPVLPNLRSFTLAAGELPRAAIQSIADADWPSLEALDLTFGDPEQPIGPKHLHALLSSPRMPRLERLALRALDCLPELVPALVASPLVKQLSHLELSGPALAPEDLAALRALGPEVSVSVL